MQPCAFAFAGPPPMTLLQRATTGAFLHGVTLRWRRPRHEGIKPAGVQSMDWRRVHDGGCEIPNSVNLCGAQSKDDEQVLQSCTKFGERLMALGKTSFAAVLLSDPGPMVSKKFGLAPYGSPAIYHQGLQPSGFTTWLGNGREVRRCDIP